MGALVVVAGVIFIAAPALLCGPPAKKTVHKNVCINNLRQIDGAKEELALEKKKTKGESIPYEELHKYIKGGAIPTCPSGGEYFLGSVDEAPRCTIEGHSLN